MTFNSFEFLIFFPIFLLCYFLLPKKLKMPAMLILSYWFYAAWNFKLLGLILFTTAVSYFCALAMEKTEKKSLKKFYITLTLLVCLGTLFFFKYYNFMADTVSGIAGAVSGKTYDFSLNLILPVGISFYTFQTLSYAIDIYRGDIKAERNFFWYALFVSFFPQLVAGPIERPENLMPQLKEFHRLDAENAFIGMQKMAVGFFKKIAVADILATYVNAVYNDIENATALGIIIATLLFAVQIYCDFSGYTDIAIGCARIMGIKLMQNFDRPYTARSIKEFWDRWHISLSTWFRDYLYIPLGGNRCGRLRCYRNLLITWLLTGIWHGATLNFAVWGLWFFFWIAMEKAFLSRVLDRVPGIFRHGYALAVILFGWLIFAADGTTLTVAGAFRYAGHLFGAGGIPLTSGTVGYEFLRNLLLLVAMTLGATPLPAALFRHFSHRLPRAGQATANLLSVASLLICTAYLVNSGYNPFLYFRF